MGCSETMIATEAGFSTVYIRVANQIETLVIVWSRGGFSIDTIKTLGINITMWMGYFNSIIKLYNFKICNLRSSLVYHQFIIIPLNILISTNL